MENKNVECKKNIKDDRYSHVSFESKDENPKIQYPQWRWDFYFRPESEHIEMRTNEIDSKNGNDLRNFREREA